MLKKNRPKAKQAISPSRLRLLVRTAQPPRNRRPRWDRRSRTLYLVDQVLKRFGRPAPNVERILDAFEKQKWVLRIRNPLPHVRGVDRKRQLHETIQNLNRRLGRRLLIFRGDGTGDGIFWQRT